MSRVKKLQVHPNAYGPGKIHRLVYSKENRMWYPSCRRPGVEYHGLEVDAKTEVTCKKCGSGR